MEKECCTFCNPQVEDVQETFNFLAQDELQALCPYLEMREWKADDTVMHEGERENYMGFLVKGKLAVKKQTGFLNKFIIIAILNQGTMVGEGAFLDHGPRSSTVVAIEDCRLLILTGEKMNQLIEDSPVLAIKLLKRILHIISLRLRKAGDRIAELL